jgi:hypothetical protein
MLNVIFSAKKALLSMKDMFNLETAVQDDKVMQDFEIESLLMGGNHSQNVKAPRLSHQNRF